MPLWAPILMAYLISFLLLEVSCTPALAGEPLRKITEKQAVQIAEKFIAVNGYTSATPASKPLARESLTLSWSEAQERSLRHETLKAKAYGICSGAKRGPGWTVIFEYTNPIYKDSGRGVTMDPFGRNVIVQHVDIYLKAAQKRYSKYR